jgi:N-acyl-D-amino-acid deacylase
VKKVAAALIFSLVLFSFEGFSRTLRYDLVIANGKILTGDGSPAFEADIGIIDGKIAKVGDISEPDAEFILFARGLYISPGFIDTHTHADRALLDIPTADNYLMQGVTTIISGNCGASKYPLSELFDQLERSEVSINFGSLAGHNTIRGLIMGRKKDDPDKRELRLMKKRLEDEMDSGALGFSSGLTYYPGIHSKTPELIELVNVLKKYDGIYASHIRSEGRGIPEAVTEVIRIGEETGVKVHISHIKLADKDVWGQTEGIKDLIEEAHIRGVRITADQYPYTASSASYLAFFPDWGRSVLRNSFKETQVYNRLKYRFSLIFYDSMDKCYISNYEPNRDYEGKNFSEILEMLGREATPENAAELLIEIQRKGNARGIFFIMQDEDIDAFMALDYIMIGSDGTILEWGDGVPHPRNYGTFPKVLRRYVKEKKTLTLEKAIRKMTSLPAKTMGLEDRGLIEEGCWADLVVFDLDTIMDTSTYENPHQYPRGIHYVLVNGKIVVEEGRLTGKRPGKVLYGKGKKTKSAE